MTFRNYVMEFQLNFDSMTKRFRHLFTVDLRKEDLWKVFIASFPTAGGIQQSYNCSCCRHFIYDFGGLVGITDDYELVSIWDFNTSESEMSSANAYMSELIKGASIKNVFLNESNKLGVESNIQITKDQMSIKWYHLSCQLPSGHASNLAGCRSGSAKEKNRILSLAKSQFDVFFRSLQELTESSVDTVLDLIDDNLLYRGTESKSKLQRFKKCLQDFNEIENPEKQKNFAFLRSREEPHSVVHIKNTAIGTLLVDLSKGLDLDIALRKYESVVAPQNYKRPKTLVTPSMVKKAEEKIIELGIQDSLKRRFATVDDLPVTHLLYKNANVKAGKAKRVYDSNLAETLSELKQESVQAKDLKTEEISIEDFAKKILLDRPESLEVLFESFHTRKLMTLITSVDTEAPLLFKWNNPFSWCYESNLADSSLKEKVKKAGGNVEGNPRISLEWFTTSDLDLAVVEPDKFTIFYGFKESPKTGGVLDVDRNASETNLTKTPVENIAYPRIKNLIPGKYRVYVHNFREREPTYDFKVEVEINGQITEYVYSSKAINPKERISVCDFEYKNNEIELTGILESKSMSREMWGLKTNQFHPVSAMMFSPNYWTEKIGNKHLFIVLKDCFNPNNVRGIFNEFLKDDLHEHRKVFEVLGQKLSVSAADLGHNQASGLGFSTTDPAEFICRLKNKNEYRLFKVKV